MSRELKDSGVEWIGKIPANWSIEKIKYTTYVKGRIGWQGLKSDEFTDEGPYLVTGKDFIGKNVNWESCHHISSERYHEAQPIQLKENDLLITKDGTIGKTAIVRDMPDKAILNSGIFVTRSAKYEVDFMYWMLNSQVFDKYIKFFETGSTIKHLYQETFENFSYPLPTRIEQKRINLFLNRKIKLVDEVIKNKGNMMTLLEKQRQSIITEAVTKGLNPNVKMKDSGIEWIGEIPEHWSTLALKHIASEKKHSFVDGPFGSDLKNEEYVDSGVPVIQLNNIKNGDLRVINMNFVTKEKSEQLKRHIAYPGDLVIAKMASPIARSAVVPKTYENYVIVADCIKLKLKENYLNHYINFAMNTPFTIAQAESFANGTTRSRVNLSIIKNLKLPIPSFEEQKEIASYLTLKVSEVNNVIKAVENQIQKLKEYRQALIYEAVTGKIDVRDMELDEVR
ncbi:restriction endonuclease subunit S [Bacillus altitudinis]|uniref:restriction endonuclease subunit S n=1 Tax=Bacillus altitudinis TaxID=293387 RepID=UPI0039E11530